MTSALPGLLLAASLFGSGLLSGLLGGGDGGDCRRSAEAGASTMNTIINEWPLRLAADPVRLYVRDLGQRLAIIADGSGGGAEWRFFVVRNLEPTAFAVGGRRFVISDGLIALVRNESDLAAVLAHEIAHQRLGHFCHDGSQNVARVHYGSIVQHFQLGMEQTADAAAVSLLRLDGFDPASMYQVLRCLSERPGAPVEQLRQRMRALESVTTSASDDSIKQNSNTFEQIRKTIVEDLDSPIVRCL